MINLDNYLDTTDHGCGRYVLKNPKEITKRFKTTAPTLVLNPSYNVAPMQQMPIVIRKDGKNHVEQMKWGLTPVWAKDNPRFPFTTINARAETLMEKPMWRTPFKKRRALVPASGYYEWKKVDPKTKHPYYFHLKDSELFALAGLYDEWVDDQTGEIHRSYSIITCEPNKIQAPIHNRMPVILNEDEESVWLEDGEDKLVALQSLLNPYDGKNFDTYRVADEVGNSRNNYPELLDPVTA